MYALSAAAVTHAVARACAAGLLPQCGCAAPPSRPPDGAFQWGGCGDDLRWAQQFTRQFVDSADRSKPDADGGRQQRDPLALVNLHNNRAGRRVCMHCINLEYSFIFVRLCCSDNLEIYLELMRTTDARYNNDCAIMTRCTSAIERQCS